METTLTIMNTNESDNQETFDPQARDDQYYSKNPYQHGTSDYGKPSEGVGTGEMVVSSDERGEIAHDISADREDNYRGSHQEETRPDTHGSTQEWDVDPTVIAKNRQDAASAPGHVESGLPSSIEGLPDNPSDEALFNRKGATYLEQDDKPAENYDPHHMGYGNGDDDKKEKS
ncbi:hypothetical protein GCM10028803_49300 [Larkinella knui]|uniref:Uncharacterized protein n=1 Tax=Larkinella knui TaxID=2025310 RepID=A0A3P1CQA2_9BACT|nr:hypothetical protein [Larkinella knui]RRB15502.1 hypothetical protein EHT87_13330 [Larkinella knui]